MESKRPRACGMPESPYMETVHVFLRIMRRHHACVERRIGDLGIHHSQHRMLIYLTHHTGEIPSQRELAEVLGVSPAAVTTTLQRLEREGYVTRTITDEDNRKNEICVTEKGRAKVMEGREAVEATDRAMFDGFTEEELATLRAMMERIDKNLDAAGAPTDPPRPRKEV